MPLARAGRGPAAIRSASAWQRRRRGPAQREIACRLRLLRAILIKHIADEVRKSSKMDERSFPFVHGDSRWRIRHKRDCGLITGSMRQGLSATYWLQDRLP